MDRLFLLPGARRPHPEVETWLATRAPPLAAIARHWFDAIRACGADVTEVMHDHQATACINDAAFAYVAVYAAHVNLGFFDGATLPDPHRLLMGSGKWMRHVKLRPEVPVDSAALTELIIAAYRSLRDSLAD